MKTRHPQGAATLLTRAGKATSRSSERAESARGGMPYALLAQSAVFLLSCCSQEKPVDQFVESIFESMRVNSHLYKQALAGPRESGWLTCLTAEKKERMT